MSECVTNSYYRLRKAQRLLSRKKRFSNNWKKQQRRIQKIHTQIAAQRNDYLHKLTTMLSKNHAIVCIEDLNVKNMSKSAKGHLEAPGKSVSIKSRLNRSILDQGLGELRRQLEYKTQWQGGMVVAVPPHYTSQQCPQCETVDSKNRKSQAEFICQTCGYENHADIVGALNVLRAGHARLACGEAALAPQ